MKAVILAGGKGTRLGKLTADIPKPMIPLCGKPLVQYQVELCVKYKIEEIIFIVNHLGKVIENHFDDGSKFGIPIRYFYEQQPLGTVGGIVEIQEELQEDFLVLYGDVMMDMDLERLVAFHQQKNSEATLVVHPNDHPYDSDLLELDKEQRICRVLPKPHSENLRYHNMVNAAVYIFSPKIFSHLVKGEKADFGKDIFPKVHQHLRMFGYNTPEYLKDMGTPDRLSKVEADILSGKVAKRSLSFPQKAIFLDRDGVINYDTDLIHRPEDFTLYDFAPEAIKSINASDYLAVITTNQSIIARNLTDLSGLAEIHKKMETELGNAGAKLDDIRFCPHHPDGGFPEENKAFKIDCHCRKPKPGMIRDAAALYNIDTEASWMIGDSERDTGAGQAAGCTTAGVRTGHGHKKATLLPDYMFENLQEAVGFIITPPWEEEVQSLHNVYKKFQTQHTNKALVVGIAGNSRSGKSTFSTRLKKSLEKANLKVETVRLDDWILPKEVRKEHDEVMYNFQVPAMTEDLRKILKGEKVKLQAYSAHPNQPSIERIYHLNKVDVVIIEGVVAFATEEIRQLTDYKIFMKIDEKIFKQRFQAFYNWKGIESEEAGKLLSHRLENEYQIIEQHERHADVVIGPSTSSGTSL